MRNDVINAVYDAVDGSRPWAAALSKLRDVTGARSLMLKFTTPHSGGNGEIYSVSPSGDADWSPNGPATRYRDRYQFEDPVCYDGMAAGEVRQLEELIDRKTFTASAFYRELCEHIDIDHAFFGYLGRIDGSDAWFNGSRGAARGPFRPEEMTSARDLLPHLARAVRMQQKTARLVTQSAVYAQSASALGVGIILVDKEGHIIDCNSEAVEILASPSPIGRIGNRVHLSGSAHRAYRSALRLMAGSAEVPAQSVRADDCGGAVDLVIRRATDLIGGTPSYPVAFAVYLKKVTNQLPSGAVEFAMQVFGLNNAEAKLAVLLAEGHALEDIAVRLRVTLTTARTYCKRAMAKTGTTRQSALVGLMLGSLARLT